MPEIALAADFAGALGLEYSRDAARVLKNAISTPGIQIDYEADAVFVKTSRKGAIIPALRELYQRIGWDAAELDAVEAQVSKFKRPRPRKVAVGDVFLVPISDEIFGLGQVLDLKFRAPTIALFPFIGSREDAADLNPSTRIPLTILHIGGRSLYQGRWPIRGNDPVQHDPSSGPGGDRMAVGSRSYGGDGPVLELLRAYAGLDEWSPMFGESDYLKRLLVR